MAGVNVIVPSVLCIFMLYFEVNACGNSTVNGTSAVQETDFSQIQNGTASSEENVVNNTATTEGITGFVEPALKYFCVFKRGLTFECFQNCTKNGDFVGIPNEKFLQYFSRNCTKRVQSRSNKWSSNNGILRRYSYIETADKKPDSVLVTCDLFANRSYECRGVADCNPANVGFMTCAGAAPWMGFYNGSPEAGNLSGNVTAEAMNR